MPVHVLSASWQIAAGCGEVKPGSPAPTHGIRHVPPMFGSAEGLPTRLSMIEEAWHKSRGCCKYGTNSRMYVYAVEIVSLHGHGFGPTVCLGRPWAEVH
jgi:hypothetical protein